MIRKTTFLALIAGGLFSSPAFAAGWGDFDAAFPAFPCNDGWVACVVGNDNRVQPGLQKGDGGLMRPAHLRLDWSGEATPMFNPFTKLSRYTGEDTAVAAAEPEDEPEEFVDEGGGDEYVPPPPANDGGGWTGGDDGSAGGDDPPPANDGGADPMVRPPGGDGGADPMVRPPGGDGGADPMVRPPGGDGGANPMVRPPGGDGGSVRPPGGDGGADPMVRPPGGDGGVKPPESGDGSDAVAAINNATQPADLGPETCDNVTMLEPAAMMGKLSDGQVGCLEASLAAATTQTDKDKLSRILMANAWSKGDKKTWEKLVKRHLDDIDQSDPDICYKYALYLSKKGPGRATGVIRWADVALENKTRWSGDTYKSRVYNLYKLRSAASQALWQQAEKKHATAPSDSTQGDVDKYRNMTKVNSREWFEYAKEAGKDTTKALQLCVSAAGTKDFCEGS